MRRLILAAAAALLTAWATPALAHAFLYRASPAVGSVVHTPPAVLQIEFDNEVLPNQCSISLSDVSGNIVPLGPLSASSDHETLTAPIRSRLAPGAYQVRWRAVSTEGHTTSGQFAFRIG